MNSDRIHLHNMTFYGYHGALAEEKKLGQRFMVDVTLFTDLQRAGRSDNLTDTINYAEVYQSVKGLVEGPGYNLLEALGESIAQALLKKFPISKVEVNIRKPSAPIVGTFDYAEVTIIRVQEG